MYYNIQNYDIGVPIILDREGVDSLNYNEVYVINEVFEINGKKYVTLYGIDNIKYGLSLFRNLEPEEEIKLRKLKIKTILNNG